MNNEELSYKLKYILNELGMNKTQFINACRKFSPSISKPTILNAINGKNTIAPTIETLSTIIKVCQTSGNEKLERISYDFLLNDNIKEVEAKNSSLYQEIGLSDDVINKLKQFNHPFYYDYSNIINHYFYKIPAKYWKYLQMLKISSDIKNDIAKWKSKKDNQIIKSIIKLFNNEWYLEYIERNFRNIYEIYISIKNNKENEINSNRLDELYNLMDIAISHFKYQLIELNTKFYENI